MTAAGNYNDSSMVINVDPTTIFADASVRVPQQAQVIAAAITAIDNIWRDLRVGWVGTSADEAQEFNRRWVAAIDGLFGTKAHPTSGALPAIAALVGIAAINYGEAEDSVQKSFLDLTASLSINAITEAGLQPPGRSNNSGPVTENNTA